MSWATEIIAIWQIIQCDLFQSDRLRLSIKLKRNISNDWRTPESMNATTHQLMHEP